MGMQTDLRAGSPLRQAATEIMNDISMDRGIDNEAFRRDMLNVFPGHPALPQQTLNMQGCNGVLPVQGPGPPGHIGYSFGGQDMFDIGPTPLNEVSTLTFSY